MKPAGKQTALFPGNEDKVGYWLTPPDLMAQLQAEFGPLEDVCPYPRPAGWNALKEPWPQRAYVNPPFVKGVSLLTWSRKAVSEAALAAWPAGGIMALVQISRKAGPASSHKPPLGFVKREDGLDVDGLLAAPRDEAQGAAAGIYEVYVYYRKLKSVHAGEWAADRRWWVK